MEPRRYLPLILVLALGGALLYGGFFSGPDDRESPSASDGDSREAEQRISGFTLNESISDTEVWSLRSPQATRTDGEVSLTSPRVVYRVNGDTRVTISSKEGSYSLESGTLRLQGNVRLERVTENHILETSTLHWDRPEGLVRTDARVILRMPRGVLRAKGMRTSIGKESVQFLSDVEFSSR